MRGGRAGGGSARAGEVSTLTGATSVAGIIGDPVIHSLSPAIHNAAYEAAGLDWVYVPFPVAEGHVSEALNGMRAMGIRGLSVTMPHKDAAAHGVDLLTERARLLGAVNTVVLRDDGTLVGDSTDGQGFLDAVAASHDFDPAGLRCVVLGAGGAARALVLALAEAQAEEVIVVNRSPGRAHAAAVLAGPRGRVGSHDDVEEADLVVNATPVGMRGHEGEQYPIDPGRLGPGQVAVDIVYHPLVTPFLRQAINAGAQAVDGLGMLVHQAAIAFTLWTGVEAPIEAMGAAARREVDSG